MLNDEKNSFSLFSVVPYTYDQQRVVNFLVERGIGGGDDPIGFLLASYDFLIKELNELKQNQSE